MASGVGLALSLPPWGWWALAFPAAGLLWWRLGGLRPRTRLWAGWLAGLGCFVPGLAWARAFTIPGALMLMAVEASFVAVACLAVPAGPAAARALAFPAALTLSEAVRMQWPFGGLPIGGVFLGQADGPVLGVARLGGPLGLTVAVYVGGVGLAALAESAVVTVRDGARARAFARTDPEGGERVGTVAGAVAGRGPLALCGAAALVILDVRGRPGRPRARRGAVGGCGDDGRRPGGRRPWVPQVPDRPGGGAGGPAVGDPPPRAG